MTSIGQRYQEGLAEATRFFKGESNVQETARRLEGRLQELGIPHAVAGGLAVVAHGHLRVTRNVDMLLTAGGLQRFKDQCLGRGWLERTEGGRRLRDAVCNVPIDVLVTGGCPGDGVPRGLTFPDPASAGVTTAQGRVLSLPVLVELKLASGLWTRDRPRDLDDVIQLIRANHLPADLGQDFHEQLRSKYAELWDAARHPSSES